MAVPVPRRAARAFWRIANPIVMPFAGIAPWWVVLETTGRKSGLRRRKPLARGPIDGDVFLLMAAHGRHADFVRNIEANPAVRIRHRRRWHEGVASVEALDPATLARFNFYGRRGAAIAGVDPVLLRITSG